MRWFVSNLFACFTALLKELEACKFSVFICWRVDLSGVIVSVCCMLEHYSVKKALYLIIFQSPMNRIPAEQKCIIHFWAWLFYFLHNHFLFRPAEEFPWNTFSSNNVEYTPPHAGYFCDFSENFKKLQKYHNLLVNVR